MTADEKITVYDVADLFNQAYSKFGTMNKGISRFTAVVIFPFNPNNFAEEDFGLLKNLGNLLDAN